MKKLVRQQLDGHIRIALFAISIAHHIQRLVSAPTNHIIGKGLSKADLQGYFCTLGTIRDWTYSLDQNSAQKSLLWWPWQCPALPALFSGRDQIFKNTSTERARQKTTLKYLSFKYLLTNPEQWLKREVKAQPNSLPNILNISGMESDCLFFSACRRAARILHRAITPPVMWEKSSACWTRALLNLLHKGLPLRNAAQAAENPSWDMSFTGQDIHCSIYGLTVLAEMYFTSASDELDGGKQQRSSSEGFFLYLICCLNHWNEDVCLAHWWVNSFAFPCVSFFHW